MMECYEKASENTDGYFMLYPGETKRDVFGSMLVGNIGNYMDWENGVYHFAEDDFKSLLQFADRFPEQKCLLSVKEVSIRRQHGNLYNNFWNHLIRKACHPVFPSVKMCWNNN